MTRVNTLEETISTSLKGLPSFPTIPDFMFQLIKILTECDKNIIEWTRGMIRIHNPQELEMKILPNYFRHTKFSSFQRQLNYFGFRKIAGKGRMTPCTYRNEHTTNDVKSLSHLKRKTKVSMCVKAMKKDSANFPNTNIKTVTSSSLVPIITSPSTSPLTFPFQGFESNLKQQLQPDIKVSSSFVPTSGSNSKNKIVVPSETCKNSSYLLFSPTSFPKNYPASQHCYSFFVNEVDHNCMLNRGVDQVHHKLDTNASLQQSYVDACSQNRNINVRSDRSFSDLSELAIIPTLRGDLCNTDEVAIPTDAFDIPYVEPLTSDILKVIG